MANQQEAAAPSAAPVTVRCIAEGWQHAGQAVAVGTTVPVNARQAARLAAAKLAEPVK